MRKNFVLFLAILLALFVVVAIVRMASVERRVLIEPSTLTVVTTTVVDTTIKPTQIKPTPTVRPKKIIQRFDQYP